MRDRKKLWILVIVIVVAMTSGFVAYKGAIAPKLYDKYLNEGIKYLQDGEYEEAILAFDKAIKIEAKSTEARVYQAKAYIGNEENDKAVEVLEEVQNIDKTNEELLKEILEILNQIDSDIAYEFLDRFVSAVGEENLSQEIKDILDSANEVPSEPIADPAPGTYMDPISVILKLDKISVGHNYYYTVDGSIPDRNSNKYSGKIEISETTTVKVIGYNKNHESTKVVTLKYIIDKEILNDTKSDIKEAEKLIEETKVGNEVGNISQSDKKKLQQILDNTNKLLNKESVEYEDVYKAKNSLEDGIKEFKNNIIKPTDKSKLKSVINEAQKLYDNSTEGSKSGQYKSGARATLLKAIKSAQNVNKDNTANQNEIDNEVIKLRNSINIFKSKKVQVDLEQQILNKYFFNRNRYTTNGYQVDEREIVKFTKNKILSRVLESDVGGDSRIDSRRQEGNTIIYKVNNRELRIEVLGSNMIRIENKTYQLLTEKQLMDKLDYEFGYGYADILKYCGVGITQSDIDRYYANR